MLASEDCILLFQIYIISYLPLTTEISQEAASLVSGVCWNIFGQTKKNKAVRDGITNLIGRVAKSLGNQEIAINVIKLISKDDTLGDFFSEVIVQVIIFE